MKNLKKTIAVVMAALVMVLAFAGCGSSSVPDAFKGRLLESYIETIQSNQYTYEASSVDGSGTPLTYAKYGEDQIMVTTTVDDTSTTMMKKDGKYYIVSGAQKAYTDATGDSKTTVENLINQFTLDNFVSATFVEAGQTKVKSVEYQYEDYYTAVTQTKNRFFFDDEGKLVMVGNVKDDGSIKSYTYMSIYTTNESTFTLLDGYQYVSQDDDSSAATTKKASTKTTTEKADK